MSKGSVIRDKSFAFAVRTVKLCRLLTDERREFVLSKQLLRSGTAIGALVREAEHAESKADFVHKMAIAQKEANETAYWLELLRETELLNQKEFDSIFSDQVEIGKILASIILTSKGKKRMVNGEL
jgi:four helix bundle protein